MFGLALSGAAVVATMGLGFALRGKKVRGSKKIFVTTLVISAIMVLTGAILALISGTASAAEAPAAAASAATGSGLGLGLIGMALATGLACIGAGVAVGSVGSAALGLVGEKPEMLGITLLYVGLAEGVAIYGIVISILIMNKL